MRKLQSANPNLTYPERKSNLEDFTATDTVSDSEIAGYLERAGEELETLVQSVKDEYCSETISSWAETNKEGVYAGFKKVYDALPAAQQAALLQQLGVSQ